MADIETFFALGVSGAVVITAVTAQSSDRVDRIDPVAPAGIAAQFDAVFSDGPVGAIKTGMLGNLEAVEAVGLALARRQGTPLVVDPVLVSTSGSLLLDPDAIGSLRRRLFPRATLLTPNLPEAAALLGHEVETETEAGAESICRALADLGPRAILLKGGHGRGETIRDWLWHDGRIILLAHPRRAGENFRGTGCTLSAAIAAWLARGESLEAAVEKALAWIDGAITAASPIGKRAMRLDRGWNLEGRTRR